MIAKKPFQRFNISSFKGTKLNRNHLDDKWLRFFLCGCTIYKLESSKNKPVIGVNFVNDGLAILKFFVELRIVTD